MTKIKLCGLSRKEDIKAANALAPDFIGFVFAEKSKRRVTHIEAVELKAELKPEIKAVGVFVNADINEVSSLLNLGVIDIAQLHGDEDDEYINKLKLVTDKPIIKAFTVKSTADVLNAEKSSADCVLLDAGKGDGKSFDWSLIQGISRPYFLAGGLDTDNAVRAVRELRPYAVDVSSGIETDGVKDRNKMAEFVSAVRKEGNL